MQRKTERTAPADGSPDARTEDVSPTEVPHVATGSPDIGAPSARTEGASAPGLAELALDGRIAWLDERFQAILELATGDRVVAPLALGSLLPEPDAWGAPDARERATLHELLRGERDHASAAWFIDRAGRRVHLSLCVALVRDTAGGPRHALATLEDTTERQRTEVSRRLLADASLALASSLDLAVTLQSVARLAVPRLADWCVVHLAGADGTLQRMATAHVNSRKDALSRELARRYPLDRHLAYPAATAFRETRPTLVPVLDSSTLRTAARDGQELALLLELAPRSEIAVPLLARGRALGVLNLLVTESERSFELSDLHLAEELARQAALAIDNARLYGASQEELAERRRAEAALREREALLRAITEGTTDAVYVKDLHGRYVMINSAGARLLGRSIDEVIGRRHEELFTDGTARNATETDERVLARGVTETFELVLNAAGAARVFLVTKGVYRDASGASIGLVGIAHEITERKRQEALLASLAEAGSVLGASLDHELTLSAVAHLAVPSLADWCAVDLLTREGELRRVAVAHGEVTGDALARLAQEEGQRTRDATVLEVLRTGQPVVIADVSADAAGVTRDPGYRDTLLRLGVRSLICVPLAARGRMLGALLFITAESARRYGPGDLPLLEELGRRAALAADNAQLYSAATSGSRAKSSFLAMISHELRTPLNAIIGFAELLIEGIPAAIPEPARGYVERIRAASRHLLQLIEEVLTFSRVEAGMTTVHLEAADVGLLLREVATMIEPLAAERGLKFIAVRPPRGIELLSDAGKVRQILINLLSNAIKFTEHGEVVLEHAIADGWITFTVRDSGPGIAPEHLAKIFDPFWRADNVHTRRVSGTGLGLSIVQQLAELLGGTVLAESTMGAGSVFTVRLPLRLERRRSTPVSARTT
jgi:PAS domain S-box-containing protein